MRSWLTTPGHFAAAFVAFGLLWILSTDWVVATFFPGIYAELQTIKGVLFVLLGGVLFYVLVDVYQRREKAAERRFQALIENSHEMIAVLDEDGRVRYRSPGYERILGYSGKELRATDPFAWVHPRDLAAIRTAFLDEPSPPGETSPMIEFRMQARDGAWHVCEGTAMNLLEDPVIGGLVVNIWDVTERVAIQNQIEQAGQLEILGQLAGGIAHDFNNLLQVITGYANLMKESIDDADPERDHVEQILNASKKGEAFIRKLLALSRHEETEPVAVDLNEAVEEMLEFTRHALPSSIELEMSFEEEVPPIALDPGQLEQVLLNLVINAKDAMPDGGVLDVQTHRMRLSWPEIREDAIIPAGEYVTLSVRDTGCGMDESTRQHVFDPFFTTKTGEGENGTGLGLATVFSIVKEWHGFVSVDSEPEEGTTFEIALPVQSEADRATGAPESSVGTRMASQIFRTG